jgi:hypothetical protein
MNFNTLTNIETPGYFGNYHAANISGGVLCLDMIQIGAIFLM